MKNIFHVLGQERAVGTEAEAPVLRCAAVD